MTDVSLRLTEALACRSAACRPPTSGGTGGSLRRRPLPDVPASDVRFSYRPRHPDGHPDPGEIVWAHVPYEDDPTQGKDRPVLIVGRAKNGNLVGVQLTSKTHRSTDIPIEWGDGNQSSVRPERFIQVDLTNYRKEGAYVKKPKFQDIVDAVSDRHGLALQQFVLESSSFACHDRSCAPPPIGTGGSKGGKMSPPANGRVVPERKIKYLDHDTLDDLGWGDEGLDLTSRARRFVASWYETDLPGGFRSEAKATMHAGHVGVSVNGKIYGPTGVQVGTFERTLTLSAGGKTVVTHDEFQLDHGYQGRGIGEALNAHAMKAYERYGVDRIELHAGYAVGGYAWAVAGFRVQPNKHKDTMNRLIRTGTEKIVGLGVRGVLTKKQVDDATAELDALDRALKSGEDVQPVHIASVGRDSTVRVRSDVGIEYDSWPGKEALLGSYWEGVYYLGDSLTASVEEFAFDPRQPRDKNGRWTVSVQHVASEANAASISREGFRLDTDEWDRSFGDGVYFSEAGDVKSAKFYARQGSGRDWRTAQVIEGTVSLANPLHIQAREHSNFRAAAVEALGGVEAVRRMAQERYDHTVAVTKRIVAEELGPDHGIDLAHPDKVFWVNYETRPGFPPSVSKKAELAAARIDDRVKQETGGSMQQNAGWRELADNIEKIAKPGVVTSGDNNVLHSRRLGNLIRDAGHDGIVISTNRWGGVGGQQIVVFDPSTINITKVRPYALRASAEDLACRDASCAPPPVGTGGSSPSARGSTWESHRGRITSLAQEAIDRASTKGVEGIFGVSDLGTVPWPTAPRRKGAALYNQELVNDALKNPPRLEQVDPRVLYATQPRLVRQHLNYYLTDEYARTGRPSADQTNPANAFPIIYVNKNDQHLILTGHHRAAAALVKNESLDAIVVREP